MKKIVIISTIILFLAGFNFGAKNALALTEAQIQSILSLISSFGVEQSIVDNVNNALRGIQTDGVNNEPTKFITIKNNLGLGYENNDVLKLQEYLSRYPSLYPEGIISGYYGALTEKAVQRFQSFCGIVSSGDPQSTGYGYVGVKTRHALENGCNKKPEQEIPPLNIGSEISIFLSTSTPLTVNIKTTVNTVRSCEKMIYELDFGDGSEIVSIFVPENLCDKLESSFSHTYLGSGQYTGSVGVGNYKSEASFILDVTYSTTTKIMIKVKELAFSNNQLR